MGTLNAWEVRRGWPAAESVHQGNVFTVFTETCSALAKLEPPAKQLQRAATFAGSHLTPHLYFGLHADHLKTVKVEWKRQRAVDFWAASSAACTGRWPSAEQRQAVNESIDRIRDDGDFGIFDDGLLPRQPEHTKTPTSPRSSPASCRSSRSPPSRWRGCELMPRIRTVKPEFWEDELLGVMPRDARLLFIATFNMAA